MIEFRRATPADAIEFYGLPPVLSFRGYAAEDDGKLIWIGGVFYQGGRKFAFSETRPETKGFKKARAKGVRILERFMDELGGPIYAVADESEPSAPYLLIKLGFRPTGEMTQMGEILVRT